MTIPLPMGPQFSRDHGIKSNCKLLLIERIVLYMMKKKLCLKYDNLSYSQSYCGKLSLKSYADLEIFLKNKKIMYQNE